MNGKKKNWNVECSESCHTLISNATEDSCAKSDRDRRRAATNNKNGIVARWKWRERWKKISANICKMTYVLNIFDLNWEMFFTRYVSLFFPLFAARVCVCWVLWLFHYVLMCRYHCWYYLLALLLLLLRFFTFYFLVLELRFFFQFFSPFSICVYFSFLANRFWFQFCNANFKLNDIKEMKNRKKVHLLNCSFGLQWA